METTGLYTSNLIAAGLAGMVIAALLTFIVIAVRRGHATAMFLPCWCPAPEVLAGVPHVCAHGHVYRYSTSVDRKGAITGTWHLQSPARPR